MYNKFFLYLEYWCFHTCRLLEYGPPMRTAVKLLDGVVVVGSVVVTVVELFPKLQDSMSGWTGPEMHSAQSNWKQKKR
jgi:hypothetical protein